MDIIKNLKCTLLDIPKGVTLVAVSKTKPIQDIQKLYDFGVRDFGENKVQELLKKSETLNKDIRWHFIGNLQRNKVKYLVDNVYLIHSLDSVKLLKEIEKEFKKKDKIANALIEINIGNEETKGGISLDKLDQLISNIEFCHNVKIKGIMAIIPKGDEISCRNYFKRVKKIYDNLKEQEFKNISMDILSMGMTNDFKYAIEEGSNLVRIGEGIFGKRNI